VTGRGRDVSSDDDSDVSSDVSGLPKFFYGRASETPAARTEDRQLQTDDVTTPRVSRDTPITGMSA